MASDASASISNGLTPEGTPADDVVSGPDVSARTGPVAGPDAGPADVGPTGRRARRVVVAEDEALIRLDIVEILREGGYEVVGEAGDGEQAVRLATELTPDLVVMDVKMPVLDGISAAERIVGARLAPVVLLTAFSQRELVERARDAGAMAYVVKPFGAADLLPALEIALSRHQEIRALESEVADLSERFETRKLVDRAKGLLQSKFSMTEPEAFRWIQKTSMDKRLTMREVAGAIVTSTSPAEGSAAVRQSGSTGVGDAPRSSGSSSSGGSSSGDGPTGGTPTPGPHRA